MPITELDCSQLVDELVAEDGEDMVLESNAAVVGGRSALETPAVGVHGVSDAIRACVPPSARRRCAARSCASPEVQERTLSRRRRP